MLLQIDPECWYWLVISILVVWRLTILICYETGPFSLMVKIRMILYRLKLGSLIDCFHCAAVWISILITLVIYKPGIKSTFLIFAIAGGTSIIEKLLFYFSNLNEEKNNENN